jgi:hypothetical protein
MVGPTRHERCPLLDKRKLSSLCFLTNTVHVQMEAKKYSRFTLSLMFADSLYNEMID